MNAACPVLLAAILSLRNVCFGQGGGDSRGWEGRADSSTKGSARRPSASSIRAILAIPSVRQLRPQVLDALYGQVKLNMGNLSIGLLESPGWMGPSTQRQRRPPGHQLERL